jgi:hypothetical protein
MKEGWKIEFESEKEFTMLKYEDTIRVGTLIIYIIIGIIVSSFFSLVSKPLAFIVFAVFFVIAFKLSFQKKLHTLTGKLIPEENKIFVVIDDKPMGYVKENGDLYMPPEIPKIVVEDLNRKIQRK